MPVSEVGSHVWVSDLGRGMGVHVMGAKGTGKSRLLGRIIAWFDYLRGVPAIVFDPLGGTIDNFLAKAGEDAIRRVRYVNMSGMAGHVVPFPFYVRLGNESLYTTARRYIDLIHRVDPNLVQAPIFGWNAFENVATYCQAPLKVAARRHRMSPFWRHGKSPRRQRKSPLAPWWSRGLLTPFLQEGPVGPIGCAPPSSGTTRRR
jgi:hypothetical protein